MSAGSDIEAVAARWVLRREEPGWTDADQRDLDAWLAASLGHKAAYWRLDHGWRQADRLAALTGSPRRHRASRHARRWAVPLAVAASILLIAILPSLLRRSAPPTTLGTYATARGDRRMVPLPDGSRVEMNTASRLRAAAFTGAREVWLDDGEAFFDVHHDAARPFVVHAGQTQVTVLGTKFSVKRIGGTVTVAVLQGRVRVTNMVGRGRPILVAAGDTAIVNDGSTLLAARSPQRVDDALAWRRGMLDFNQATLAEAAADFSRYRNRPMVVTGDAASQVRISGSFEAANADAFVRLLHDAYGLRIVEKADATEISD